MPTLLATTLLAVPAAASGAVIPAPAPAAVFRAPDGRAVEVFPLRHASVRVRFGGLEIHVDPVGAPLPPPIDYTAFPKADLILVTHEHFDHFDRDAIETLRSPSTVLFANSAVRAVLGWGTPLANGESAAFRDGVSVLAVPAHNTSPDRLRFHPRGRDNGYVLDLGGFRVYFAGDTEETANMASLPPIDLAFLPCNLPYTMTPEQTAAATRTIPPKVLIPYHCPPDAARRVADLLAGSGIDVRLLP